MKKNKIVVRLLSVILVAIVAGAAVMLSACPKNVTFVPDKFTITYTTNGGQANPNNPTEFVASELPLTIKPALDREGWVFLGWTSEINANPSTEVEIPEGTRQNLTFVAVWEEIEGNNEDERQIIYKPEGGTNNAANPAVYDINNLPVTIEAPSREDYIFKGWTDGSGAEPANPYIISEDKGVLTLTAVWEIIPEATEEPAGYGVGKIKAPGFTLWSVGENEKQYSLSDYYGKKAVLISIWGVSCNDCKDEMKGSFAEVYDKMKEKVEILAVHVEPSSGLMSHLNSNKYYFPVLSDENRTEVSPYLGTYIPRNFLVDKWGYLYSPDYSGSDVKNYDLGKLLKTNYLTNLINDTVNRAKNFTA